MPVENMTAPAWIASSRRRALLAAAGALLGFSGLALPGATPVGAAESVTYLFPAPPVLPAFGPIQLAKGKGYFARSRCPRRR